MNNVWKIEKLLPSVPSLDHLEEIGDVLSINLSFPKGKILFNQYFSFRVIHASDAMATLQEHPLDGNFCLFQTRESEFIYWFDKESENLYGNSIIHYRFILFEHIIDVLSSHHPEIAI